MQKNLKNRKLQVFIADDSALVRQRLVSMLCDVDGVQIVGQAEDGSQAADLIRELKPDAITLDIHMPGGTGLGVLQKIRLDKPQFEEAPVVIMLSNYSHTLYRRKAMNAGANFFFDKSTEFEKVREVLVSMADLELSNCQARSCANQSRGDARI
jgi:DNA-binding NarL/FixJ family response regulator